MSWTIGGVDFDSLGVESAVLTRQFNGGDTLTLSLASPLDGAFPFAPYAGLQLKQDGTTRWKGWVKRRALSASPGERKTLVFECAWRFLDRANYVQPRPVLGGTDPLLQALTAIMLGQEVVLIEDGTAVRTDKISASAQLAFLAGQLNDKFGITLSGSLPDLKLPWMPKTNATIGSCLLALLAWFPSYGLRSTIDGNLELVDGLDSWATSHALSELDPVRSTQIEPLHDQLMKRTRLTYTQPGVTIEGVGPTIAATLVDEAVTEDSDSPWDYEVTIELELGEPFPDEGIAAALHAWYGRLMLATDFAINGLAWDMQPGDQLDLGGIFAGHGAAPVLQQVDFDLFREVTTGRAGPRRHLGLDQLLELNRKTPKGGGSGGGGGEPPDEESGTVNITISGPEGFDSSEAKWTVGDVSGQGNGSATLAPGNYTVIFQQVWDTELGWLYVAEPVAVEVVDGGSTSASGGYEALKRFQVKESADNKGIDLDPTQLGEADAIMMPRVSRGIHLAKVMECDVLRTDWRDLPT